MMDILFKGTPSMQKSETRIFTPDNYITDVVEMPDGRFGYLPRMYIV